MKDGMRLKVVPYLTGSREPYSTWDSKDFFAVMAMYLKTSFKSVTKDFYAF